MSTSPTQATQPTDSFPNLGNSPDPFCAELHRRLDESGISEERFARLCKAEAASLLEKGRITQAQFKEIAVHRTTLSRILSGGARYTRLQVLLWARVLRKWYVSEECLHYFAKQSMFPPRFDESVEKSFIESAGFVSEERRKEALLRTTEEQAIVAVPRKQFVTPGRRS